MAAVAVLNGKNYGIAKKLASTDQGTREKAIGLLILWLSCEQQIGEDELKRIWKGLFYCVWHADKAPVQAELIEKLASLLESVEIDLSVSFFKVFLSTMRREWAGIDRLRMDKFYLLLRKFLSHMFKALEKGGWDHEVVTKFMVALEERAFLAQDRFPALGVNLHFADIFWQEFRRFLPVPQGTLDLLLEPFYSILRASSDKALLRRVKENIFNPLLDDARALVSNTEKGPGEDSPSANFGCLLDSRSVAPRLFDLASSPATAQANRKVLYELNDEFSKLAKVFESCKDSAVLFTGIANGNASRKAIGNGALKSSASGHMQDNLLVASGNSVDLSARLRKRAGRAASAVTESGQPGDTPKAKKTKTVKEPHVVKGERRKSAEETTFQVSQVVEAAGAAVVASDGGKTMKKRRVKSKILDSGNVESSSQKKKSSSKVSKSGTGLPSEKKSTSRGVDGDGKSRKRSPKIVDDGGDADEGTQDGLRLEKEPLMAKADASGQKSSEKKKREKPKGRRAKANEEANLNSSPTAGAAQGKLEAHVNGSVRDAENGHADSGVQAYGAEPGCALSEIGDITDVSSNLENKFDLVAAESASDSIASVRETDLNCSLETSPKNKRKRGKASVKAAAESSGVIVDNENIGTPDSVSGRQQSTPVSGAATPTLKDTAKKTVKRVRFVLKNNVVCEIDGPRPPLAVRTPPSATPRGSALKAGVLPGPIRTRPLRVVRGASLRSRRRASSALTKSKQKPKSSAKKLKRKTKVVRITFEQ